MDRECVSDAALRERVEALLHASHPPDRPRRNPTDDAGAIASDAPRFAATNFDIRGAITGTFCPEASQSHVTEEYDPSRATDTCAEAPIRPEPVGVWSGAIIGGRYTLVERIGEGGMGSVYLASQTEPVRRQVAIKLIKMGMDSRTVLARFDAERQALAVMDHPNIARIYDGGISSTGQPFFVMELVRGVPITAYCDNHRLPVGERLRLFVAVCQAVQHAHQKGIIHRDLKPGNVLVMEVDGRPTPKVIDFGVAKATEQKLTDISFSDAGAVVGTPAYMSPEQADPTSMDIDTRTDIYALGVMLYELLTGSTPIDSKRFKRGAMHEMLRIIREVEPPRPSTKLSGSDVLPSIAANRSIEPARLSKLLRGELDWVVMKALEKDRTRRYDSANGFAEDIRRYLADEVVKARPPSTGYRLKKFVRRHKRPVAVAAFFLLTMAIALPVVAILAVTAESARREAIAARELETGERQRAERNFETSRALAIELSNKIESFETGLGSQGQTDLARKAALDSARATFDKFRAERPDDRPLQRQAAALHRYAANLSRLLNDNAGAEKAYSTSIGIREQLVESDPDAFDDRDDLAQALRDFGTFQKRIGRLKEAAKTLERAAALAEETKDHLPESSYRRTLGTILMDRADVEYRKGEFTAAEASVQKGGELLDRLEDAPKAELNPIDPLLAAIAQVGRAMSLRELGRIPEAIRVHDNAVARLEAMGGATGTRDVRHSTNKAKLERAITRGRLADDREGTVVELAGVLQAADKLIAEYPGAPIYKEVQVGAWLVRAELATALGRPKSASEDLAKALAATRELLTKHENQPDHIGLRARAYLLLGRLAAGEKKPADAEKSLDTAIKVYGFAVQFDPDHFGYRLGLEEATKELRAAKSKP